MTDTTPYFDIKGTYTIQQWLEYVIEYFNGEAEESIYYNLEAVKQLDDVGFDQWIEFLYSSMTELSTIYTENKEADTEVELSINTCSGDYGYFYRMVLDRAPKTDRVRKVIATETNFFNSHDTVNFLDGRHTKSENLQTDAVQTLYFQDVRFFIRDLHEKCTSLLTGDKAYIKRDMLQYLYSEECTTQLLCKEIDAIPGYFASYLYELNSDDSIEILHNIAKSPAVDIKLHAALLECLYWMEPALSDDDIRTRVQLRSYMEATYPDALKAYDVLTGIGIHDINQINTALTGTINAVLLETTDTTVTF